jgi:4'-phosphopantetheinyl transferase
MNATLETWLTPPRCPHIEACEVHVWRAYLNQSDSTLSSLWTLLSADERERAQRFHFREDRDRYVTARGALRDILSRYLENSPREIRFIYSEYGKPMLDDEVGGARLTFNLSHSRELALYAVAESRAVGVDVEFVREDCAGIDIAERFFSSEECSALRALAREQRTAAFFNCWTRKEAYIKARGLGLSLPLDSFSVSIAPGEPAALLCANDARDISRWCLVNVLLDDDDYAGALAVEGHIQRVRCWQW